MGYLQTTCLFRNAFQNSFYEGDRGFALLTKAALKSLGLESLCLVLRAAL
jgi:hypothetical protein